MVIPSPTTQIDPFQNIRGFAPEELFRLLEQILGFFPEEFRYRVQRVIDNVPADGDNMHKVFELVRGQWRGITSEEWVQIAITGPSQAGKSSLLRAIQRQETGLQPIFRILETPGLEEYLGFGSASGSAQRIARSEVVILVLDGRYELTPKTLEMVDSVRKSGRPLLVILNKMDLVEDPGKAVKEAKGWLGQTVFPTSAKDPASIRRLLRAVVAANARTLYPLSQNFPEFREAICDGIVAQAALTAGLVAAIPIPVSDLLPLTAVQTGMILKTARSFGYPITRKRARELIPMLLAGSLVREGAHHLREHFPRQAKLISITVAGIWTMLLGKLAMLYFEQFAETERGAKMLELPQIPQ